jgi:PTS system glucose-specific IIA component
LGTFDLAYLKEKGKETTTVLVFTNFDEKISELKRLDSDEVNAGAQIGELVLK